MSISSIHPQNPQLRNGDENSLGQQLLGLVKSVEKRGCVKSTEELAVLVNALSERYLRRGLLGGDTEKAAKIMSTGRKAPNHGRDKRSGSKTSSNKVQDDDDDLEMDVDSGFATDDITLLLSAIVRITGGNYELSSLKACLAFPQHLVISGFNACIAILQSILSRSKKQEACSLAEYEILAGISRSLLTGVSRTLSGWLDGDRRDQTVPIVSFRVATLIISLYGMKLSRNPTVLSSLRTLAWKFISISDEGLQKSASDLLAALPLTGMDKNSPSVLWTDSTIEGIAALIVLLETVAPMKNKSSSLDITRAQGYLSETTTIIVSDWLKRLHNESSPELRLILFTTLTSGLSQYIVSLLEIECLAGQETPIMSSARFAVVEILDLLESMFAFPSVAENLYYGTKKRLRMEIIEDGLLSPHIIANYAANHIKRNGLSIFNAVLQSLGRSVLLPFGSRIVKLAQSSLQTACSTALRHAIDPNSQIRFDGKRKKWLHTSVEMRANAIECFDAMICTIGSNALVSPSSSGTGSKRVRTTQAHKGVTLVVGCLLEQLTIRDSQEDWGSTQECVTLVCATLTAMSSVLSEGGGFLSFSSRSLIDSAIKACLHNYLTRTTNCVFSSTDAKLAFLQLVSTCVITPWPDGAVTSLVDDVEQATKFLASDLDMNVASDARKCYQLIHCMKIPRCPPLLIVTRASSNDRPFNNQEGSAGAIVDRLKAVPVLQVVEDVSNEGNSKSPKRKKGNTSQLVDGIVAKRTKPEAPTLTSGPKADSNPAPVPMDEISESADNFAVSRSNVKTSDVDAIDDDMDDMMPGIIDTGPDEDD